jgi:hypothetical protein
LATDSLSVHPALTEVASAAQLGLTLQSTVTAGQQGNVVAAIFDGAEAAVQAVGTVNQASSDDYSICWPIRTAAAAPRSDRVTKGSQERGPVC